ncbi:jg10158 [Pararge aegeria aegeria]|uniref:Jg10158 protein n=1 Tax=Pararge aegeria aegeria TaxID=348720 RepID=A0A8S4R6X2_9NEOP|nr:jg10158 [Pararge aegeria aegeria]
MLNELYLHYYFLFVAVIEKIVIELLSTYFNKLSWSFIVHHLHQNNNPLQSTGLTKEGVKAVVLNAGPVKIGGLHLGPDHNNLGPDSKESS